MDINLFFMAILVVCNLITTGITLKAVFEKKHENESADTKSKFAHVA